MRRRARPNRAGGPWIYLLGVSLMIGGAHMDPPNPDQPTSAELRQRERCEPVELHAGMDPQGWGLLMEQGYATRDGDASRLYPPGCESVMPR